MYIPEIREQSDKSVIPEAKGWKVLIAIPTFSEKTEGGILLPEDIRHREEVASILGYVVALGDLAYGDKEKFPTGPWCKPGDWVIVRPYTGTRVKVDEQEFRLINDDSVEAVVENPVKIVRAI